MSIHFRITREQLTVLMEKDFMERWRYFHRPSIRPNHYLSVDIYLPPGLQHPRHDLPSGQSVWELEAKNVGRHEEGRVLKME